MADKGKKEEDPEVLLQRKFHMKCLFRALGRMVMANAHWLIEASEHYEGVEDVKRRVEQAVRSKGKKKQLLNINDKTLLNKPAEDRTEQEKRYLYRIIGGLKCFKRYPNNVKRKLAAVTYFKYYGPGRTIVRQHHEAHALYFIVTGDVVVSQMIYDELLQQYVSVDVGAMHPGDMFGEVSLLHNIPRTATVTTTGHCELLALMKEDFKSILQASVQKQWDEVRRAMSAFSYFDSLDEVARREGCIVAKMRSYAPDETLLGDGVGVANFVYFILSGKCQMIESMKVIVTTHFGNKHYTLYDPYAVHLVVIDHRGLYISFAEQSKKSDVFSEQVSNEESEQDFEKKYFANINLEDKESCISKTASSSTHVSDGQENNVSNKYSREGKVDEKRSSISKQDKHYSSLKTDNDMHITLGEEQQSQLEGINLSEAEIIMSKELLKPTDRDHFLDSMRFSLPNATLGPLRNISTYFMQVCQFNPGSSFGFGENMRDRRIVALTHVTCMLLPQVWLLQRNSANIWTRIKHYLERKILSKRQLFDMFVAERRWTEYREQVVADIVSRSKTVNATSIHDVPYSIRVEEIVED